MLPLSFTAEILGIHVKGRLTLSGEELEAMDSFQLGDAMSQVRGLHRSYIVVVCRMCSDLLIGVIFFGGGGLSRTLWYSFLTSYGRKKEIINLTYMLVKWPFSLHCIV